MKNHIENLRELIESIEVFIDVIEDGFECENDNSINRHIDVYFGTCDVLRVEMEKMKEKYGSLTIKEASELLKNED